MRIVDITSPLCFYFMNWRKRRVQIFENIVGCDMWVYFEFDIKLCYWHNLLTFSLLTSVHKSPVCDSAFWTVRSK
jgi:hypothetical protein